VSQWQFPPLDDLPAEEDLIASGADLEIATILEAYRSGYFPMPIKGRSIGWFSPDPRGVLLPGHLVVSKSLRRSLKRYTVTFDSAFERVVRACADPGRPHGWINRKVAIAYTHLHEAGHAHSVETWDGDELVGGLYGVSIGGLFAGESMFQRKNDASKVALVHLAQHLGMYPEVNNPGVLLDVQWITPHLESLGVVPVQRGDYGRLLATALERPGPGWLAEKA
jgi:leucyl/phenylalanyl-tRNA--protein transferase